MRLVGSLAALVALTSSMVVSDHAVPDFPVALGAASPTDDSWLLLARSYPDRELLLMATPSGEVTAVGGLDGNLDRFESLSASAGQPAFGGFVGYVDIADRRLYGLDDAGVLRPFDFRPTTASVTRVVGQATMAEFLGVDTLAVVDLATGAAVEVPKDVTSGGYRPGALVASGLVAFGRRKGGAERTDVFEFEDGELRASLVGRPVALGPDGVITQDGDVLRTWAPDGAPLSVITDPVVASALHVAGAADGSAVLVTPTQTAVVQVGDVAARVVASHPQQTESSVSVMADGAVLVRFGDPGEPSLVIRGGEVVGQAILHGLSIGEAGARCMVAKNASGATHITSAGEIRDLPPLGDDRFHSDDYCTVVFDERDGTSQLLRNGEVSPLTGLSPLGLSSDGRWLTATPGAEWPGPTMVVVDLRTGVPTTVEFPAMIGEVRIQLTGSGA